MPIYEYKCHKCGHIYEKFRKIGEHSSARCEICGSKTRRIFSPVGIVFKGKGFYTTDYKEKKEVKEEVGEKPAVKKPIKKDGEHKDDSAV